MENKTPSAGKCPVMHGGATAMSTANMDWWPNADKLIEPSPQASKCLIAANN
jgi:catalase (peroxidase I)